MVIIGDVPALSQDLILEWLKEVPDPEIPAINVVEMGIVRDISYSSAEGKNDPQVLVKITPTYSGCPAMKAIEGDIIRVLKSHGVSNARIELVYSPAWSSSWLTQSARDKLKASGIAPPLNSDDGKAAELVAIGKRREAVACPYCDSFTTTLRSEFGSTACKALYYCDGCKQPFEYFKEI